MHNKETNVLYHMVFLSTITFYLLFKTFLHNNNFVSNEYFLHKKYRFVLVKCTNKMTYFTPAGLPCKPKGFCSAVSHDYLNGPHTYRGQTRVGTLKLLNNKELANK